MHKDYSADRSAVSLLSSLLRADTTNPPGNEGTAAEILEARLSEGGLSPRIFVSPEGRPSLVTRVEGPPDRPALVLLSHLDVVGVEPDRWTHDPFGGEVSGGFVWGRGALDMKGIAVMHAEAARALAASGEDPTRELILVAVADEEAGGREGARWLLEDHPDVLGFAEGRAPPEVIGEGGFGLTGILDRPILPIVLGEKRALWLSLEALGDPGHGSLPPSTQAPLNLARFIASVAGYGRARVHPVMRRQLRMLATAAPGARRAVFAALASAAGTGVARALHPMLAAKGTIGALLADTVTPTRLDAGYKHNVVPGTANGGLDCRLLPDTDLDDFLEKLRSKAARYGVSVHPSEQGAGPVSRPGLLYPVIEQAGRSLPGDPLVVPSLTPGFTDVRLFRARGATGYGWVPLILTPELLATVHGHDERIPIDGFERAVAATTAAVVRGCTRSLSATASPQTRS